MSPNKVVNTHTTATTIAIHDKFHPTDNYYYTTKMDPPSFYYCKNSPNDKMYDVPTILSYRH